MKRLAIAGAIAGLIFGISTMLVGAVAEQKVLVCHKQDTETVSFTVQSINLSDVTEAKADGDFIYNGSTNPISPTWCTNNQPGDVCPNIDGLQTKIPEGKVLIAGQCVDPPVVTPPAPVTPTPVVPVTIVNK